MVHPFVYMYLIGLLIGLGLYALTYLFAKEIENETRILVLIIISVLTFVVSLIIIGGFAGMPFAVLSLGILTIAFLLYLFGKSLLGKKIIFGFIILFVLSYSAFIYFN